LRERLIRADCKRDNANEGQIEIRGSIEPASPHKDFGRKKLNFKNANDCLLIQAKERINGVCFQSKKLPPNQE